VTDVGTLSAGTEIHGGVCTAGKEGDADALAVSQHDVVFSRN
jgi:hypothetical protein